MIKVLVTICILALVAVIAYTQVIKPTADLLRANTLQINGVVNSN